MPRRDGGTEAIQQQLRLGSGHGPTLYADAAMFYNGPAGDFMDRLRDILDRLAGGTCSVDEAARLVHELATQPLGFATLDHHRHQRCGVPEVVYAAGKLPHQVCEIAAHLVDRNGHALITRASADHLAALSARFDRLHLGHRTSTLIVGDPPPTTGSPIPIITAGTSDESVAQEAELTCRSMGQATQRINDVGVAGLSRLISRMNELQSTGVIIAIAGMEGALPSVLGGLVDVPVIAVPTSVGYGAALGGFTALMGMLTSCAAGVTVVNIDNGFGAAYTATLIQRQFDRISPESRAKRP
jgi:NCAIR mutase (PurE)-related protein